MAEGPTCPVSGGIFLDQGSNPWAHMQGEFLTTEPPGMSSKADS